MIIIMGSGGNEKKRLESKLEGERNTKLTHLKMMEWLSPRLWSTSLPQQSTREDHAWSRRNDGVGQVLVCSQKYKKQ